jgi:hypothetical protein
MAQCFSFRALTQLGRLDQARVQREQTLSQAREHMHVPTLAMVIGIALICHALIRTRPEILLPYADELVILAAENGFPYWVW